MSGEMGVTDYLHEMELWRDSMVAWRRSLPETVHRSVAREWAGLIALYNGAETRARLLRRRLGMDPPLPAELEKDQELLPRQLYYIMQRMEALHLVLCAQARVLGIPCPPRPPTVTLQLDSARR